MPTEHAVAVTTQEALDGNRETMRRIASIENITLNWVSSSTREVLDMTISDFSVRTARNEIKHIIGSSPVSSLGLTKIGTEGAGGWRKTTWSFCLSCMKHKQSVDEQALLCSWQGRHCDETKGTFDITRCTRE